MKKLLLGIYFILAVSFISAQDIEISIATTDQLNPCVASSGGSYMVMWEDNRVGTSNKNIYAQPVNGDGTVPLIILPACVTPGNQKDPEIACYGDDFLTIWKEEASSEISGRFSTLDALGTGPYTVASPSACGQIAISEGNSRYFTVWDESGVVKALPLTLDGSAEMSYFTVNTSSYTQSKPDVDFHDGVYVVVYEELRGTDRTVVGKYIYANGTTHTDAFDIGPGTENSTVPAVTSNGSIVLCVFVANNSASGTGGDIMGQIITPDAVGEPFDIAVAVGEQSNPDVEWGDGAFFVAYEDFGEGYFADIKGQWVSATGSLIEDPVTISSEMAAQNDPKLAYGDGNFLCVWEDRRRGGADIFGHIIDMISVSSGPSASVLYPARSSVTSCPDQEIRILITDDDGVDFSTCELEINSTTYTTASSEVTVSGDTLIFAPSISWIDGSDINYRLTRCEDMTGASMSGSINITFSVDLTHPRFEGPSPANGSTVPTLPTMISINIFDDGSGIDESSIRLTWDTLDLTYPDPALYWNGITFALFVDSLAEVPVMPENQICVTAMDSPDLCDPNEYEFCWQFTNTSDVSEPKPAQWSLRGAYPNPFNSAVEIIFPELSGRVSELRITDVTGKVVDVLESTSGNWKWHPAGCESGVYLYSVEGSDISGKLIYSK